MNTNQLITLIKQIVADEAGITIAELVSKRRPHRTVWPRQVAMWACRRCQVEVFGRSFDRPSLHAIGDAFGTFNHGTVAYASRHVDDARSVYPLVCQATDALLVKIQSEIARQTGDNIVPMDFERRHSLCGKPRSAD